MSLYWTGKWHITFPAFLILSDTSSLSLNDPLLSTTEYVSGAVVTWQGCLDRLGEVTENVTDTSRTHGSSLFLTLTGKGSQCPKAWLREPAVCLVHLWQAWRGNKASKKAGLVPEKLCCVPFLSQSLSSFPGTCVRNGSPPWITGLVLRWAQSVTPMKVVERTEKEGRCLVGWAGRDGGTRWSGEAGGGGEACWDWRSGLWEESAVDLLWCAMGPDVICAIEKDVESRKCLVCITLL